MKKSWIRTLSLFLFALLLITTVVPYTATVAFAEGEDDAEDGEVLLTADGDDAMDGEMSDGDENPDGEADGTDGEEPSGDQTSFSVRINRYLSTKYYTPEEKLDPEKDPYMTKMVPDINGYSIYCNTITGEVVVENNKTKQRLFTNPYDVATSASSADTKKKLLSQLIVKYIDNGTSKTFYSFTEAAERQQINVKYIKNGIRVEYSIGREDSRVLVPRMIKNERFMEIFYEPLKEIMHEREVEYAAEGKDVEADNDIIWFECSRFLNYFVKKDKNDPTLSNRAVKEMIARYPIVNKMAIWATSEDIQPAELTLLEGYIKKYIPQYSYEDLDTDHAITNYVGQDKAPALFRMALEYTIDDEGLSVRLPAKGLRYDAINYTLETVSVLPYMGCGSYENNGYTFLPDGSGALFRFEDFAGKSVNITSKMYGQDYGYYTIGEAHREVMRLPVFGVAESVDNDYDVLIEKAVLNEDGYEEVPAKYETRNYKEERGFVAVIEAGDAIAELTTEHGGSLHKYCTAYTSYRPRPSDEYNIADVVSAASSQVWTVTSKRKYVGDIKIRYQMLAGKDEAAKDSSLYENSYVGMATAYREYLWRTGALTRLTDSDIAKDIPLYIETFGTLETTKRVLSVPVKVKRALTTFEDVQTMYDELAEQGVTNIQFKLTGYANGGMYATAPTKVSWEKAAGGSSGFKDLIAYAQEKGFGVYPDFDFAEVKELGGGFSKDYLVKTINSRYTHKQVYDSTLQCFIPSGGLIVSAASYDKMYQSFNKDYGKTGWDQISLSSIASDISTDFDKNDPYNREDSKNYTIELLESVSEDHPKIMAEGGNVFTAKYLTHLLNAPIDSSRYTLSSETVPFLGMVFHGSLQFAGQAINMAGDFDYSFLKSIENGANLYFILSYQDTQILKEYPDLSNNYSVRFDIWFDDLVEKYQELNGIMSDLQTEVIVSHEFLRGERTPDEDEIENDKTEAAKTAEETEKLLAEYEEKLEKAINFAKRKGTYDADFEANFKKKYYPIPEPEETDDDEEPEENEEPATKYTNDNGNIVRVTYSNGTTFILNYNAFEVTVNVDGKDQKIGAFSYEILK